MAWEWVSPVLKFVKWLIPWIGKSPGIQLHSPAPGVKVRRGVVNVRGSFKKQPEKHCWLFLQYGQKYWPQHEPQFDANDKTWDGDVYIGKQIASPVRIVLVELSDDLHRLAEYYGRVHQETGDYVSIIITKEPSTFKVLASINVPV
jgi:hypothetical protein